jgi:hypothetical protein
MLVIVGGAAFLIGLIVALIGMNQLKVKKLTADGAQDDRAASVPSVRFRPRPQSPPARVP